MFRIIVLACSILLSGCFDETATEKERQKNVAEQLGNQQYDHRSLEQRVRESSAKKKQDQTAQ